jgi:hypothetical protein
MASVKQLSFSGGEVSPSLYARVDQVKYQTGLRTCLNFMVMRHGGVANRPGTEFIEEVKTSAKKVRLIPFIFNADQTYVLEFGDLYMRVIRNGAQVESGGSPYEIVTPYAETDLSTLQYVQSADTITITHPSYAQRELTRTAHDNWTLSAITFGATIAAPTNPVVSGGSGVPSTPTGLSAPGGDGSQIYKVTAFNESPAPIAESKASNQAASSASGGDVVLVWNAVAGAEGYALYKDNGVGVFGIIYVGANNGYTDAGGADVPATAVRTAPEFASGSKNYNYKVTAVSATTSEESLPSSAAGVTSTAAVSASNPLTVSWSAVTGAGYYNVYREINGQYGWIGVAGGTSFEDTGYTPDALDTPPEDRQPFTGAGNYPSAVTYYQQRRIFANTDNNPEGVWASRIALRKNFMVSTPLQDDDAVTFSMVGRQVNEVRHLLDLGKLVAFTASGEWSIEGDAAGILTPGEVNPKQYTANGSGSLAPLVVGGSAVYVQARGAVVRDLAYEFEANGYRGNELSIFAAHLFEGYALTDWAYQQIPHSIVWAVRDDGVLLGLTYVREHEVRGWHRHEFYNGLVENVCIVPEGDEDFLYLAVKRTINGSTKRYIERMHTRQVADIVDSVFMDSSLTYDGRNTDAGHTMTLSGGTEWTYEESLTLTSSAVYFVLGDVGNDIWLYDADGEVIRCNIKAFTSDQVVTVKPNRTVPVALRSAAISEWSKAVDQVSGLSHLEGEDVAIFADGYVSASPNNASYTTRTVTSGAVSLAEPHAVIHVGLPITADIETLDIDNPQGPSMADKKKNVNKLTMFVESSRGIFAGPDATRLYEVKARNDEGYDEPVDLETGKVEINISSDWNSSGKVLIRQVDPLPLALLAIVPSGYIPA